MASLTPGQSRNKLQSSPDDKDAQPGSKEDTGNAKDVMENDGSENGSTGSAESGEVRDSRGDEDDDNTPPLPDEAPPLPAEGPPGVPPEEDDGWAPVWEPTSQAFYFFNRFTGASQWTNPRVPDSPAATAPGVEAPKPSLSESYTAPPPPTSDLPPAGGYNPALHGDYDPSAWYAQPSAPLNTEAQTGASADPSAQYAATAAFNRFTGRFQTSEITPENYNDENKSKRQMNAFFDVDAAANSHDGKSLKAERSGKKISKTELKQFKEKRKAKKEEKRRAWLRD